MDSCIQYSEDLSLDSILRSEGHPQNRDLRAWDEFWRSSFESLNPLSLCHQLITLTWLTLTWGIAL